MKFSLNCDLWSLNFKDIFCLGLHCVQKKEIFRQLIPIFAAGRPKLSMSTGPGKLVSWSPL